MLEARASTSGGADWRAKLDQHLGGGFLEAVEMEQHRILRFGLPAVLEIKPDVVSGILSGYSQKECGGVIACRPRREQVERVFCAERSICIENVSRSPYRSYLPKQTAWKATMTEVASDGLLPVEFHSHPIPVKNSGEFRAEYMNMTRTSRADELIADTVVTWGQHALAIPQIVVVRASPKSTELFIGLFGGLVAPPDFESAIREAGLRKTTDIANSVFELVGEKHPVLGGLLGIGVFALSALSGAGKGLGLMEAKMVGTAQAYFGVARTTEMARISLPDRPVGQRTLESIYTLEL
jgi:hypothetical protein